MCQDHAKMGWPKCSKTDVQKKSDLIWQKDIEFEFAHFLQRPLALEMAGGQMQEAADNGANLVVLPEMWNCPYSNDSFPTYAEDIDGGASPSGSMLASAAKQLGITVGLAICLRPCTTGPEPSVVLAVLSSFLIGLVFGLEGNF